MTQFVDLEVLTLFVPTFFFVSATPGMCMTLAMTLGMTIGFRRTLWMMGGELFGVALVALASVLGVSGIMLANPALFWALKLCGAGYLLYLSWQLWHSEGSSSLRNDAASATIGRIGLAMQGFLTAVGNPKGWAFMIALLPAFISNDKPLAPQLAVLLGLFLLIEASCLVVYASGGRTLSKFLTEAHHLRNLNRCASTLMALVAVWLLAS